MTVGPGGVPQSNLSIGVTQYGNGGRVVNEYVRRGGKYLREKAPFGNTFLASSALTHNNTVKRVWQLAGSDVIMGNVQGDLCVR